MKRMNFPGRKTARQEKAKEMQETRNQLTAKQQLAVLDSRLGKDMGAKKERARLLKQLEK